MLTETDKKELGTGPVRLIAGPEPAETEAVSSRAQPRMRWAEQVLARQCAKYAVSVRLGETARRADQDSVAQVQNFRQSVARTTQTLGLARTFLMRRGVPTIRFVSYFNFCRHLGRVLANGPARDRQPEVRAAVGLWTAKGLNPALLEALVAEVFGLRPGATRGFSAGGASGAPCPPWSAKGASGGL